MRLSIIAAAAVLTACTVPEEGEGGTERAAAETAPTQNEVVSEPMPSGPASVKPLGPPPESADECGASNYQYLVGQPRSSIPEKPANANWRITCSSCPVTMDYSPARMNIFYDEETEVIEEVKCG